MKAITLSLALTLLSTLNVLGQTISTTTNSYKGKVWHTVTVQFEADSIKSNPIVRFNFRTEAGSNLEYLSLNSYVNTDIIDGRNIVTITVHPEQLNVLSAFKGLQLTSIKINTQEVKF